MNKSRVVGLILAIFLTTPIWFYLVYKMLQAVNASEVMWLLYWVYVPATLLVHICTAIATED